MGKFDLNFIFIRCIIKSKNIIIPGVNNNDLSIENLSTDRSSADFSINSSSNQSQTEMNSIAEIENKNTPIVIYSCGNGGPYEVFHKNNFWIDFYLNQDFHICFWNF